MSLGFKGLVILEQDEDTLALMKIVLKQANIKEKNGNVLVINPHPISPNVAVEMCFDLQDQSFSCEIALILMVHVWRSSVNAFRRMLRRKHRCTPHHWDVHPPTR